MYEERFNVHHYRIAIREFGTTTGPTSVAIIGNEDSVVTCVYSAQNHMRKLFFLSLSG